MPRIKQNISLSRNTYTNKTDFKRCNAPKYIPTPGTVRDIVCGLNKGTL